MRETVHCPDRAFDSTVGYHLRRAYTMTVTLPSLGVYFIHSMGVNRRLAGDEDSHW